MTSPPLTRRAASTAHQSIRLLLCSGLFDVVVALLVYFPFDQGTRVPQRPRVGAAKRSFSDKDEWRAVLKVLQEAGKLTYSEETDSISLPAPMPPLEKLLTYLSNYLAVACVCAVGPCTWWMCGGCRPLGPFIFCFYFLPPTRTL